jgi:hypothetical protein
MPNDAHEINKEFVFVTAHDAVRISKQFNFDPHHFLEFLSEQQESKYPGFKLKGKNYLLALNTDYAYVNFCIDYLNNKKQTAKELKEYENIVGKWNRNFGEKGSFMEFLNFILREAKI